MTAAPGAQTSVPPLDYSAHIEESLVDYELDPSDQEWVETDHTAGQEEPEEQEEQEEEEEEEQAVEEQSRSSGQSDTEREVNGEGDD